MKTLITLIAFFLSSALMAQQTQTVESLGEGSCWLASMGEGQVSIASFNDKKSTILTGQEIQEHVESLLRELGAQIKSLNTFVHCSSHGLGVVFSMNTDQGGVCLWSRLGERGELEESSAGHMGASAAGKFCDGAQWGELMVLTKGEGAGEALVAELETILGNGEGFEVKALGKSVYKVILNKAHFGDEHRVKQALLASSALVPVIRSVEYSSFYHPIGEVRELSEFSYHE